VEDLNILIRELKDVIEISGDDEERFRRELGRKRRFEGVPLRYRLSDKEVARFSVNRHRFPGVDIHARLTREYPMGSLGVHALGYVGRIDETELQRIDEANYRATSHIGKTGVERAYEDMLHGQVGYKHVETNAQGRVLRELERVAPVPGGNIYLTIDASLQAVAEAALKQQKGAVVAIEPATGAVLAMASTPGYDPNLFVNGIDVDTYRGLNASPDRPLFDRAIFGQYPPGSTVKPFVALAGLERVPEHANEQAWCGGWYRLKGHKRRYRDWKRGGHGRVGLKRAIVESCDVYFYGLALALGIDPLHDFMTQFGFGMKTGIDLEQEVSGLMPSSEWKMRTQQMPWFPGETLITGIGQGFTLATPLQLASATATLSLRGRRLKPRLVERLEDPETHEQTVFPPQSLETVTLSDPRHWDRVFEAMTDVIHGERGTARRIGVGAQYHMSGKTGTAQVRGLAQDEEYDEEQTPKHLQDHALFIAFAPTEQPRIAISVIVENGGSGSKMAAPIARQVMDYYLLDSSDGPNRQDFILTSGTAQ
jgi:penicillin-binding protein 2